MFFLLFLRHTGSKSDLHVLLYDTTGGMLHCLRTGLLKPWPVFSGTSPLSLSLPFPHVHEQTSITAYSLECLTPLL